MKNPRERDTTPVLLTATEYHPTVIYLYIQEIINESGYSLHDLMPVTEISVTLSGSVFIPLVKTGAECLEPCKLAFRIYQKLKLLKTEDKDGMAQPILKTVLKPKELKIRSYSPKNHYASPDTEHALSNEVFVDKKYLSFEFSFTKFDIIFNIEV